MWRQVLLQAGLRISPAAIRQNRHRHRQTRLIEPRLSGELQRNTGQLLKD